MSEMAIKMRVCVYLLSLLLITHARKSRDVHVLAAMLPPIKSHRALALCLIAPSQPYYSEWILSRGENCSPAFTVYVQSMAVARTMQWDQLEFHHTVLGLVGLWGLQLSGLSLSSKVARHEPLLSSCSYRGCKYRSQVAMKVLGVLIWLYQTTPLQKLWNSF